MLVIRSVVFNVLFYLNLLVQLVAALPTLVMPRGAILAVARFWARTNLWLLRAICGIKVEFRGLGKIPSGPLLVASKHQSLWETFALLLILPDPAYIMKRELMWIPFFGWYAWKAGMIAVDRSKGSQALADMNASVRRELARDRQIVIFPEGHAPGARRRTEIQVRRRAPVCRNGRSMPPGRAQFRPVLASPRVPALSGDGPASRCSIRSSPASTRMCSSSGCSARSKARPRVLSPKASVSWPRRHRAPRAGRHPESVPLYPVFSAAAA